MRADSGRPESQGQRIFLHEPGWQIGRKVGSVREFCYTIAPGEDSYHRLLDGELFLYNPEERLCFACAQRRGLLSTEPRSLGGSLGAIELAPEGTSEFEVEPPDPSEGP